jgi:hypothetical protein
MLVLIHGALAFSCDVCSQCLDAALRKSYKLVGRARENGDGICLEKAAYVIASMFLDPHQVCSVFDRSVVAAGIAVVNKYWQHGIY